MAYREEDMFAFVMGNSYRVYLINEYFLENQFKPGKLLNFFFVFKSKHYLIFVFKYLKYRYMIWNVSLNNKADITGNARGVDSYM